MRNYGENLGIVKEKRRKGQILEVSLRWVKFFLLSTKANINGLVFPAVKEATEYRP